jgi:hypothetical protein
MKSVINSMIWGIIGGAGGGAAQFGGIGKTARRGGAKPAAALSTRDRFLLNWRRHTFCLMRAVPRLADAVCPDAEIKWHGFQRRTGPRQADAAALPAALPSETGHARTEEQ